MSGIGKNRLLDWVDDQIQLPTATKYVLDKLARFADANGESWAPVARLAVLVNCDERSIQNHLKRLKDDGLIVDTGRKHRLPDSTRSVPLYQLAPELLEAPKSAKAMGENSSPIDAASMGETVSPIDPAWVKKSGRMGENCFTRIEPLNPPLSDESEGARARDPEFSDEDRALFEAVAGEWGLFAPDRVAKLLDWPCWLAAMGRCEDGSAGLARAARRYLAESADVRDRMTKAFGRWLRDGRWETWLALPVAPVAGGTRTRFADAVVRAAVVEARQEAFAASYLDPAGWDGEGRTIAPVTAYAAAKLNEIAHVLRKAGAAVGEVKRVSVDGEVG